MEASALQVSSSPVRARLPLPSLLLRLRSDEQLVTLFRAGHDEAFRVIHDRYQQRLFAYTRQMLPRRQDAEDALQDVFARVYMYLRASNREVGNLRPWLYRAAHNRCIDELRRPSVPPPEVLAEIRSPTQDPMTQIVERDSLRCVLEDIGRLPVQQRSALLLRELGGAHYADIAEALGTTVPAVKSLLVRARVALTASLEARDTPCSTIREELALAHDRRATPTATARAHLRDCAGCRSFRQELRGTSKQLAGLVPTLGPLGILANALGFGGAGSGASAGSGAAVAGGSGAIGGGAVASAGMVSAGHVATVIAAVVATAGGALQVQSMINAGSQQAATAPATISTPSPSATDLAPSAAASTASTALTPKRIIPPTAPTTVTSTTASPPHDTASPRPPAATTSSPSKSPAHSASQGPVRQPSITGISTVSQSNAGRASAIGYTSITGTPEVSAVKPSTGSPSGSGSGTSTNSSPSGSSAGTTNTTDSTAAGSQGSTSGSSQTGSSDSTQSTSHSSSTGSTTSGTTSTGAPAQ